MNVALDDLLINKANDRHGELVDESAAIEWLLTHRADHMRNLAKDIVGERKIYEPPLVHHNNDTFVVYDGNRRITCLKLLNKPNHAPSEDWREFFQGLRDQWQGEFPDKIACRIEKDRDQIDEILHRRHTGGQSGVGQSQWDAEAKSNFVRRTGKKTAVNVAEDIENKLKEGGHIGQSAKVPRSNLNRLLSSESFRNRVGISISKSHVELTHDENKVMAALSRIVKDLIDKKIVLEDIWSNKGKKEYLDLLETEDILPTAEDSLTKNKNFKTLKPIAKSTEGILPNNTFNKPKTRKTLIRLEDGDGLVSLSHTKRAIDIWNELKFHLKFGEHDNAIAVLFRVLLELAVGNYIDRQSVTTVNLGDKLAKKFMKALNHMHSADTIDKKYHDDLKKFENAEPILSANTLNGYVHHKNFYPSDHHLKSMWDTLSDFIVICLKA